MVYGGMGALRGGMGKAILRMRRRPSVAQRKICVLEFSAVCPRKAEMWQGAGSVPGN
ncbi:hypothetical protein CBM2599_B50438 [Cupriavidus taiwanensis]|nr:hypothetical protein CBM2600_B10552 [Cupriavidus taiwanensis]SOY96506.1 hypothetical protein CBM2599_B50438 [Cupriavidus taiwanensis]